MSERLRGNLIKYGISGGLCAIYIVCHCVSRDVGQVSLVDQYRIVADSFTVPGMLFIFSGLITWLSNEGAFNGLSYVFKTAVQSLIFLGRRGPVETYGDYVENRRKKQTKGYGFLFVVGAVCLAVAGVFIALYYRVYS